MPDIWQKDRLYAFLRPYVDFCTRGSYRSFRVSGSLPPDKAVLIAPNHCNTLMDALVVLATRSAGTAFGARADVFRKPRVARILRWLKIVPIARARDGLREVAQNRETMVEIDDILAHGMPFCLFPEGRHRTERTLLPLQKGIARIAFASAAERPTCIVPTGISYSDFFHFRSTCRIRFGEPIDVNLFLSRYQDYSEADRYHFLLEELSARIQPLIDPEPARLKAWWKWPAIVLGFPFWLASALLTLPLWLPSELLCHRLKDPAFRNTVRYGFKLLGMPLLLVLWAIPAFLLLPWWAALAALVFLLFSYRIFYDGILLSRDSRRPC